MQTTFFDIRDDEAFIEEVLRIFYYQAENNPVYRNYISLLGIQAKSITTLDKIPFLPIQFFKSHRVLTKEMSPEITFLSSGTSGMTQSKHHVADVRLYEESYLKSFEKFYGPVEELVVLALLPSYLERDGSSLIYMVDDFIKRSKQPESGFYLHNLNDLKSVLEKVEKAGKKTLLIGVSFALLDLIEVHQFNLKNTIVMETGGMKGRRKEMVRAELHFLLKNGFGVEKIHSEYGMTELLSQAYSKGDGVFECPPWMRILIRDTGDPLSLLPQGKTGGVNIIDLANKNSCSFIASQDLGKLQADGSFEILGRFDNSDIRGCNLLLS